MHGRSAGISRNASQRGRQGRREISQNRSEHSAIEEMKEDEGTEQEISKFPEKKGNEAGEDTAKLQIYYAVLDFLVRRMETLLRLNFPDHDIRPYREVVDKRVVTYKIRRIVSPCEFYLEYSFGRNCYNYKDFFPEMQEYYGNEVNQRKKALVRMTFAFKIIIND